MIKSKEGTVKYNGREEEIRADLICIFRALNKEDIIEDEDDVLSLYKLACLDEHELNNMIADKLQEIKEKLKNIGLGDILK